MKRLTIGALCALAILPATAQTADNDTIKSRELKEIVVEARNQRLGAEVSVYIPTQKQKNASQTASDLLNRMAIPQLNVSPDGSVKDVAGKDVDIFIDFLPASKEDLESMRMQDVRKVEYYDYPSDPRFQGKAHVVNFVMQKYEYGGYVKGYGWQSSLGAGQASAFSKVQYKRMTFDIALGAFYTNSNHNGEESRETFRLPQQDGSIKEFERSSVQDEGRLRRRYCWPTFKAKYSTDKITIQNIIGGNFNNIPVKEQSGHITYAPEISPRCDYSSSSAERANSFSYTGYWNFVLDGNNTLTFSPRYGYSHTKTNSLYAESGAGEYFNAAKDDSHRFSGNLTYAHSFGKWGNLNVIVNTAVSSSSTTYSGTASTADNTLIYRIVPGIQYSISKGKVYGLAGFGMGWNSQKYIDHKEQTAVPWVDLSLQYSPNDRHSVRGEFHHSRSTPSSGFLSSAVIQSNPLMSYTGNPELKPYRSYDASVSYSFVPNNKFSFSAFANTWIVKNRYVYDYRPTPTGILRTIMQPGGGYSQWYYGAYGTVRLFDRRLQLTGQLIMTSVHNGKPYDLNKTEANVSLQATYYLDNWSFSGIYFSPQGYPDGCMVGTWMKNQPLYMVQAGWGNSSWNIQMQLFNFDRWNWKSERSEMHSPYYDKTNQAYSTNYHALAKLSVTYTFGFGKKVEHGNEASQQSGISSGILK